MPPVARWASTSYLPNRPRPPLPGASVAMTTSLTAATGARESPAIIPGAYRGRQRGGWFLSPLAPWKGRGVGGEGSLTMDCIARAHTHRFPLTPDPSPAGGEGRRGSLTPACEPAAGSP